MTQGRAVHSATYKPELNERQDASFCSVTLSTDATSGDSTMIRPLWNTISDSGCDTFGHDDIKFSPNHMHAHINNVFGNGKMWLSYEGSRREGGENPATTLQCPFTATCIPIASRIYTVLILCILPFRITPITSFSRVLLKKFTCFLS